MDEDNLVAEQFEIGDIVKYIFVNHDEEGSASFYLVLDIADRNTFDGIEYKLYDILNLETGKVYREQLIVNFGYDRKYIKIA